MKKDSGIMCKASDNIGTFDYRGTKYALTDCYLFEVQNIKVFQMEETTETAIKREEREKEIEELN